MEKMKDDMYCVVGNTWADREWPVCCEFADGDCNTCPHCKHKWPTVKQFCKEYGKEVPEHQPVYVEVACAYRFIYSYATAKQKGFSDRDLLIACTLFGTPPIGYRPEEDA